MFNLDIDEDKIGKFLNVYFLQGGILKKFGMYF